MPFIFKVPPPIWDVNKSSSIWTITNSFATTQPSGAINPESVRSFVGVSAGKHYIELTMRGSGAGRYSFGVATETADFTTNPRLTPAHWYYTDQANRYEREGTFIDSLDILPDNVTTTIGMGVNMDTKVLTFYDVSGIITGTTNFINQFPLTGGATNPAKVFINIGSEGGSTWGSVDANFGQNIFTYTVPSGFNPGWPGYF